MLKSPPKLKSIGTILVAGFSMKMSQERDLTQELWSNFMPQRNHIKNRKSKKYFSISIYPKNYQNQPHEEYTKWAGVEIHDKIYDKSKFELLQIPTGEYAVFHYKGLSSDPSIFIYIFTQWLPSSGFKLDNRPHFEVLGPKYKNNDPDSEEEIWIPIK